MKILAIRGCNLASLAGEFEIDLLGAPLGAAGVFAIVGNTGAGKSTLLDALCVALFDRTPRLTNHSTVKVGRGDDRALLGAQDVRTLLRRGAAQGWAEVDFESRDARRYRARWSVRRARGHSDGTLQDQQLSLTALDGGERLGGTKTETLRAIHARLGLSFDQFRRSALLAQGEFAAFLRADGKDRSELLERMTGTQIYTRLSVAAHVKAALAEQRLRDGRAAALAITVLDDVAAETIRAELALARAAAAEVRRRHAAAEHAARWLAEAGRRARELADATAEHAAARAALVAAEADRAELALRRRAEQLRPAWDHVARVERALAVASGDVAAAGEAAARAARELAAIAEQRARIWALHAPVRTARIAAGIVEQAAAGAGGGGLADRAEQLAAAAAGDAAWLVVRAQLAPEVAGWAELDARFAQHAALGEAIAALDRALAEQAESKLKLERAHKVAAGELRTASHKHEDAKRKAQAFSHRRGLTLDAARRLEDEARTHLAEVDRLVAIAAGARAQVAARADIDHQLAQLAAAAAGDAGRRAELADAARLAQVLRDEQARAVDELRRAAGYEHARAELVAGEPCPLCGATEHPWRDRGALDAVIASASERLAATVAELDAIAAEAAALSGRGQHREREQARLVAQRAESIAAAAAAAAAWRAQLGALGELLLVDDPSQPAAEVIAGDRLALARQALEEARATRSQTEAATKAAADAQAEVQLCQVAVDQLAGKLAELDRRLADLEAALGRSRGERVSKLEHHGALAGEIGEAMARWLAALPGDADGPGVAGNARARRGGAARAPGAHVGASGDGVRGPELEPGTRHPDVDRQGAHMGVSGARGPGAGPRINPVPVAAREDGFRSAAGAIDQGLVLALVARLQASAPVHPARDAVPNSPIAIVRFAMAAVVSAWRERAGRIAHADAVLTAAAAAIEVAARDADRAVAEYTARRSDAERRRDDLARERAEAAETLEAARVAAGFGPGPEAARVGPRPAPDAAGSRSAASLAAPGLSDELGRLLAGDPARVDVLAERLASLERAVERTRTVVSERERQVAEHAATRAGLALDALRADAASEPGGREPGGRELTPPVLAALAAAPGDAITRASATASTGAPVALSPAMAVADEPADRQRAADAAEREIAAQLDRLAAAVAAADRRVAELDHALAADVDARARRDMALAELASEEAGAEIDRVLGEVIGSHDGKLFRSFAQSLTLDSLLAVANAHLDELAPRYQLERVPRHDLELQVIDRDLGGEVRSVQSLSGGESFLVSLALALGLSSMSAHDVRVRTLLIDEGFGTLDPSTLDSALSVLDALQATGRQVGVISHVPALVERVGAHVRVVQRGSGRSEVIVA